MALYTKKEFAQLIGLAEKHLPTYFDRGKFAYVGTNKGKGALIDGDAPINSALIAERQLAMRKRSDPTYEEPKVVVEYTPPPVLPEFVPISQPKTLFPSFSAPKRPQPAPNPQTLVKNAENTQRFDADTKLKELEINKKRLEIDNLELKKQKITGSVVPSEAVIPMFKSQNEIMMKSLKYGLDDFIRDAAAMFSLQNDQIAILRGKVIKTVNDASQKALKDGITSINNIIEIYSDSRGRGERM